MTDGQRLALEQLQEIEQASEGLLEIVKHCTEEWLGIEVSLACDEYPRTAKGLPLRQRERFFIGVDTDFPSHPPALLVAHTRWAGAPHVQWGNSLCLYQSPATEWDSADGMYGFMQRLENWLRHGALGELNPTGQPLHPPIAYRTDCKDVLVPQANTPVSLPERPWIGVARLAARGDMRHDIVEWVHLLDDRLPENAALAILLAEEMPFEFPSKLSDLLKQLEQRGVSEDLFGLLLQIARSLQSSEQPLRIIIGTPMRGIAGGERKQHLTAWRLEADAGKLLAECLEMVRGSESGEKLRQAIHNWAAVSPIAWCRVLENRSEVTVRRDADSPTAWFAGKSIALWGCGALGSHIAEMIVRAGAARLVLVDNGIVKPGILVRQLFEDRDIGKPKALALARRLRRIRPDLDVEPRICDVLGGPLAEEDWSGGADLVIDATASRPVLAKLERRVAAAARRTAPVMSCVIGHDARDGFVVLAGPGFSGGPEDVCRRVKAVLSDQGELQHFLDEFFPHATRQQIPFQPEPGCSESTFTGSAADVSLLASAMLNAAAKDVASQDKALATAHFFRQPGWKSESERLYARMSWEPDFVFTDRHTGYEVRVTRQAWEAMLDWIHDSNDVRGVAPETGGLLFGEYDDAAKIVWVREVIGPPSDSEHSPELFVCGIEGTRHAAEKIAERSHGSNRYVGMWHTHPTSDPLPSTTDLTAMERLLNETPLPPRRTLLIIIGETLRRQSVGAYFFRRADFNAEEVWKRKCAIHIMEGTSVQVRRSGAGKAAKQKGRRQ